MIFIISKWFIIFSGIWLLVVSIIMLTRPASAIKILKNAASTNLVNYSELGLRGIWGIALLLYASHSLFPGFFQALGILLCISTLILLVIPRKWHAGYAVWWAGRMTKWMVRLCSPFSFLFGLFLIYAVI